MAELHPQGVQVLTGVFEEIGMQNVFKLTLAVLLITACGRVTSQENIEHIEYVEVAFMTPLTIDIGERRVILSDYGIDDAFCKDASYFCVIAPVVTAALVDIPILEAWAGSNGWQLSWEPERAMVPFARLIATNSVDETSWVSVYNGGTYPILIYSASIDEQGVPTPLGPIYVLDEGLSKQPGLK